MSSCFAIKGFEIPKELYTACDITESWCHFLIVTRMLCFVTLHRHLLKSWGIPVSTPTDMGYPSGGRNHALSSWPGLARPKTLTFQGISNFPQTPKPFFPLSFWFVEPQHVTPDTFLETSPISGTILRNAIRGRVSFTIFHSSYSVAIVKIIIDWQLYVVERKWKSTKHPLDVMWKHNQHDKVVSKLVKIGVNLDIDGSINK